MFKFIKRLFYLTVIFAGLYFFGDFSVGGVNVRDFLQKNVTKENYLAAKAKLVAVYELLMKGKELMDAQTGTATSTTSVTSTNPGENKDSKPDPNLEKAKQMYMDHVTGEDRKKLEEMIKKQLGGQ